MAFPSRFNDILVVVNGLTILGKSCIETKHDLTLIATLLRFVIAVKILSKVISEILVPPFEQRENSSPL